MNDPGVFPFLSVAAGLVEAVDGGLGRAFVRLPESRTDGFPTESPGRGQPFEAVEDLGSLRAETNDPGSELSLAAQGANHVGFGLGVGQAIASIGLAQLVQRQGTELAEVRLGHGMPRDSPVDSEQGNGGPARPARLLPPRF